MKWVQAIPEKILTLEQAVIRATQWRVTGKTIAFTNGVFDMLHSGHIYSLTEAAREADYLVVGLNADVSVKRLKGNDRPIQDETARSLLLASLVMVDAVVLFPDDTPAELITRIRPDVLVKGGDYTVDQVVGAREVMASGGRVVINKIIEGFSTTRLISRIREA